MQHLSVENTDRERQNESAEASDNIQHPANESLNKDSELMEELSEIQRHVSDTSSPQNNKRSYDSCNNRFKKIKTKHVSNDSGDGSQFDSSPSTTTTNGSASSSEIMINR